MRSASCNVRNAVKHLGRLTGGEALGRTQTIRAMQLLPCVEAAYAAGLIPIAHVRLIARVAANPRVHEHLETADPIFADQATKLEFDPFQTWMQQWLFLASVNIVIDQQTFEDELRRACGETVEHDRNVGIDGRVCHTMDGTPLHPSDVLAAAMVGFVRRVVVDGAGTVIDLGRRRRLFTGSSREAALLQAFLREPGGLECFWPGCDGGDRQVDHRRPASAGGPTTPWNSDLYCGTHNRLKETGFKPVRGPDGTWRMHRPDGAPITPAA